MRPCLPLLALVLSAAALTAQTAPLTHSTVLTAVQSTNCPVTFAARRWTDGSALQKIGDKQAGSLEHGLLLHADRDTSGSPVSFATVIVHGSAPEARLTPAASTPSSASLRQTFHLAEFPRDPDGNWKLTTDRVPLIHEIEVTEMHFANGTFWHTSANSQCRLQPDGFLRVASLR